MSSFHKLWNMHINRKKMIHIGEKLQARWTTQQSPDVRLNTQDFQVAISNMFNELKETVFKGIKYDKMSYEMEIISSVQSLSHVWLLATPWTTARQASLSITNSWTLLKLRSIESVMPSNHLTLCHPLLLLPSIFPSIRDFSNKLALCIRWPKYWSFSFSISPSNEYSGLISFRIDWFNFLAVQRTLKSLLQLHSSKASILWCSAFFMVQLSSMHDCFKNHSFD